MPLTPRDTEFAVGTLKSLKEPPQVDFDKLATVMGITSSGSARNGYHTAMKKIRDEDTVAALMRQTKLNSGTAKSPAKPTAARKTAIPKNGANAVKAKDDDEGGPAKPTAGKKIATPKKATKAAVTEEDNEDQGEDDDDDEEETNVSTSTNEPAKSTPKKTPRTPKAKANGVVNTTESSLSSEKTETAKIKEAGKTKKAEKGQNPENPVQAKPASKAALVKSPNVVDSLTIPTTAGAPLTDPASATATAPKAGRPSIPTSPTNKRIRKSSTGENGADPPTTPKRRRRTAQQKADDEAAEEARIKAELKAAVLADEDTEPTVSDDNDEEMGDSIILAHPDNNKEEEAGTGEGNGKGGKGLKKKRERFEIGGRWITPVTTPGGSEHDDE